MERTLEGRIAVVTGAGTRVGRAIAEGLGARGAGVVVHFSTHRQGAEEVVRELRAAGTPSEAVQADLTRPDEVARVFAAADALGGCDLLVNSAAIFERRSIEDMDDASWRRMLEVNLSAPFFCAREALPGMRRRGGGAIVNIVDVGGALSAWRGYAHYCSAKAGLAMLTRCLALELAPSIRVNAIAPGAVLFPESFSEDQKERVLARIPLGRAGTPADVAQAVVYLATAPFVTGQILAVDGGRSIA